jgi:DNA-binding transcriptional regulator YdaS (Cro superfamily)
MKRFMSKSPLERAIGDMTQQAFADLVGASQPLVSYWLRTGRVGGQHVLNVEAATGISRHDLRPDIFGPSEKEAA